MATSIVLFLLLTLSWGSTGQAYPAIGSFVRSREKIFLAIRLVRTICLQSDSSGIQYTKTTWLDGTMRMTAGPLYERLWCNSCLVV